MHYRTWGQTGRAWDGGHKTQGPIAMTKQDKITAAKFEAARERAAAAIVQHKCRARIAALAAFWTRVKSRLADRLERCDDSEITETCSAMADVERIRRAKSLMFTSRRGENPYKMAAAGLFGPVRAYFTGWRERRRTGGTAFSGTGALAEVVYEELCATGCSSAVDRPEYSNPIQNVFWALTRADTTVEGWQGYMSSTLRGGVNRLAEMRGHALKLGETGLELEDPEETGYDQHVWSGGSSNEAWYVSCTGRTVARFTNGWNAPALEIWHECGYHVKALTEKDAVEFEWRFDRAS